MILREPLTRHFNRVGFDLDDTLAEGVWPDPHIGQPIQKGIDLIHYFWDRGYAIVIFTSRPESHLPRINQWLFDNGLSNIVYDVICGKPQFDYLIDDRALNFPGEVATGPCGSPTCNCQDLINA